MDRFSICLPYILKDEGGNDDDPHDPGGRTSRGIIQREYDSWRKSHSQSLRDVWIASDKEISDIYYNQYWQPYCDRMPHGLDYLLFDMNVNMGPHQASLLLQRGLGVNADGHIGLITLSAAKVCDAKTTIENVTQSKIAFYKGLRTFRYYGKGWLNRVASVETIALSMID